MKYDVLTIGGAVRDTTFYLEHKKIFPKYICFPYGEKIRIKEAVSSSGGGACNVAVGLVNFGLKVAPVVRVGNDWRGKGILQRFKEMKVDTKFVQIDNKMKTGVSAIINPRKGDRTILTYRGANENLEINKKVLSAKTKWIYIAALPNKWFDIAQPIFNLKKKNISPRMTHLGRENLQIAWNPGSTQIKDKRVKNFLKLVDLLIVNKEEASLLTKTPERDVLAMLKKIMIMGPKIVVITCGGNGAYVAEENEIIYGKSKAAKVVSTTGAGDSFSSGFLAALIFYHDIKKALNLGLFNSAANLTKVGAQDGLLTKKDLKKIKL